MTTTPADHARALRIIQPIWEHLKYEAWWLSETIPRLRFCRRRYCLRVVAAYPFMRPPLCRKHRREDWMAATAHIRNCDHAHTRPNVEAGDDPRLRNPRVCLDCGVGIVTWEAKP